MGAKRALGQPANSSEHMFLSCVFAAQLHSPGAGPRMPPREAEDNISSEHHFFLVHVMHGPTLVNIYVYMINYIYMMLVYTICVYRVYIYRQQ